MTNRHLPETEAANLAFHTEARKRQVLEAWVRPRTITKTYSPFRFTYPDAVNKQLPLYPDGQIPTPWERLEEATAAKCGGDQELMAMNISVAKATHAFATQRGLIAEPIEIRGLTMLPGHAYNFGPPLFFRYEGGVSVAFADLRRSGELTEHGRRVTFSYQHQRFRENYPDHDLLRLEVWRYLSRDDRAIQVFRHDGEPLYGYDELSNDLRETYRILGEVLAEAAASRRGRRDRGFGPLFGT